MKKFLFMLAFALSFLYVQAAYLKNVPVTVTQPDGTVLKCFATGDEFYNYLHDAEGFTIIQDAQTGFYVYADLRDGELVSTNLIAGKNNPATKLKPHLNISPEKRMEKRKAWDIPEKYRVEKTRAGEYNHGTLNNISIFIRFSDDPEFTNTYSSINNMFNDSTSGAVSMYNYFKAASYNQIHIPTTFYPGHNNETIISYKDTQPRNYFRPYNATTNTIGYTSDEDSRLREFALLQRAVRYINIYYPIPSSLNIDYDNDNYVDNVCFIVKGSVGDWGSLLWPHQWKLYDRIVYINGKIVNTFNFQLADATSYFNTSTMCHEMNHSLGSPDLYHYNEDVFTPVGRWDLMEENASPPQHCGAYMKWKYNNWIDEIPEITASGTYTLNDISSATNNCYKIASSVSGQYYVLEYRNKNKEPALPGSGLLIYRINTAFSGNRDYNPSEGIYDEIYIYRPDGTTSANGNINNAHFNSGVNRTTFRAGTNPQPFLTYGTIDNDLIITGITTAGNTISFTYEATRYFSTTTNFQIFQTCSGTPSESQSFSIVGNYVPSNVVVNAPAGFELSLSENGTYSNSLTITPVNNVFASTTIYVRLSGNTAGSYIGDIIVSCSGYVKNLSVGGFVGRRPAPHLQASASAINFGESITLTATAGSDEYQWFVEGESTAFDTTTTNTIDITPTASNSYIVTAVNRDTINSVPFNMLSVGDIITTDNIVVKPADWATLSAAPYNKEAWGVVYHISDTLLRVVGKEEKDRWYGERRIINGVTMAGDEIVALADFNGIRNTEALLAAYPSAEHAANYCNSKGGYLPACGELLALCRNRDVVNTSLDIINGEKVSIGVLYWSSTDRNIDYSWTVSSYLANIAPKTFRKDNDLKTRAVRAYAPGSVITSFYSACEETSNAASVAIIDHCSVTGNLSDFQTCFGTANEAQSFSISGIYVINNVIVNVSTDFELSLSESEGYSNSITLTPVNNVLPNTTVFVRLSGSTVGSYTGDITISCNSFVKTIPITGFVGRQPATPDLDVVSPICWGESTTLTATVSTDSISSYEYQWFVEGESTAFAITNSNTIDVSPTSNTNYFVTAVNRDTHIRFTTAFTFDNISVGDIITTDSIVVKPADWTTLSSAPYNKEAWGVVYHISDTLLRVVEKEEKDRWYGERKIINGVTMAVDETAALADFNGIRNTEALLAEYPSAEHAANYCYSKGGYLPACGELLALCRNRDVVNTSLNIINGENVSIGVLYWSSTDCNIDYSWTVSSYLTGITHQTFRKDNDLKTRAVRAYTPGSVIKSFNLACEATSDILSVEVLDYISVSSDFTNFQTCSGTPSEVQSFSIAGDNVPDVVVVTAPEGFELSRSENGTYSNDITLSPVNNVLTVTTVYVRLSGNTAGYYIDNIEISCGNCAKTISVTGLVGEQPATPDLQTTASYISIGESTTLTATPGSDEYQWFVEGESIAFEITSSNTIDVSPITNTTYFVKAANKYNFNSHVISVGDIITTDSIAVKPSDWAMVSAEPYNKEAWGVVYHTSDTLLRVVGKEEKGRWWGEFLLVNGVTTADDEAAARADFNGIRNTEALLAAYPSAEHAANYCYSKGGYLPACGELLALFRNRDVVNTSLDIIYGENVSIGILYWSSTDYNTYYSWAVANITPQTYRKDRDQKARTVRAYTQGTVQLFDRISIYPTCEATSATVSVTVGTSSVIDYSVSAAFSGFQSCLGSSGTAQNFCIKGSNVSSNAIINASPGFELGLSENGNYSSSLTLIPTYNVLDSTTVYVRLSDENITGGCTGDITVSCSGYTETFPVTGFVGWQTATTATLQAADSNLFLGKSTTLTATPGSQEYQWFVEGENNAFATTTVNSIVVSPTVSTNYIVSAVNRDTLVKISSIIPFDSIAVGDIITTDSVVVKPADWAMFSAAPLNKEAWGVVYHKSDTLLRVVGVNQAGGRTGKKWGTYGDNVGNGITRTEDSNIAAADYNGIRNTEALLTKYPTSEGNDYAANWCEAQGGYLPAFGEIAILIGNKNVVNTTLNTIGGTQLWYSAAEREYWSSTEYSDWKSWYLLTDDNSSVFYFPDVKNYLQSQTRAVRAYRPGTIQQYSFDNLPIYTECEVISDVVSVFVADYSVTAGQLGFYTCSGTPCAAQSFNIEGSIVPSDVIVTAPAGFELSLSDNGGYSDSLILTPVNNVLASTPVYVRLSGSTAGEYIGRIAVSCSGFVKTVSVAGLVGEQPVPTLQATAPTIQLGESTILTATAGSDEYQWFVEGESTAFDTTATNSITVSPSASTNYIVNAVNRETLNSHVISVGDIITTDSIAVKASDWAMVSAAPYHKEAWGVVYHVSDTLLRVVGLNQTDNLTWGVIGDSIGNGIFSHGDESVVGNDFSGKKNTEALLNKYPSDNYAVNWCDAQGGYLPACGELMAFANDFITINQSLQIAGGSMIDISHYWSSTESSHTSYKYAWSVFFYRNIGEAFSVNRSLSNNMKVCVVRAYASGTIESFDNITVHTECEATSDVASVTVVDYSVTANLGSFETCSESPSEAQSFSIEGSIVPSNVIVTAPAGYELSRNEGGTYSNDLILSPVNNVLDTTTVYVRLSGITAGEYIGDIEISCNSYSKTISVVGLTGEQPAIPDLQASASAIYLGESTTLTTTDGSNKYQWFVEGETTPFATTVTNTIDVSPTTNTNYIVKAVNRNSLVKIDTALSVPFYRFSVGDIITRDGFAVKPADWPIISAAPYNKVALGVVYKVSENALSVVSKFETAKEWGAYGDIVGYGITTTANGNIAINDRNGRQNTQALMRQYPDPKDYAANWCNSVIGGYLPACGELVDMMRVLSTINGPLRMVGGSPINNSWYWSSTQYNGGKTWMVYRGGTMNSDNKNFVKKIRAVRTFIPSTIKLFTKLVIYLECEAMSDVASVAVVDYSVTSNLGGFQTCYGTPSAEQSFSIAGNSVPSDITVTAPAGFELCRSVDGTYSSSLTLSPENNALTSKTVYVRLSGSAAGSYIGDIIISCSGYDKTISVVGLTGGQTTPTLQATDSTICLGESTTLTATAGSDEYIWFVEGESTAFDTTATNTVDVSPATNTNYIVTTVKRDTLERIDTVIAVPFNRLAVGYIITTDSVAVKPADWATYSAAPYNKVAWGVVYHISDTLLRVVGLNEKSSKYWGNDESVGNGIFSSNIQSEAENDFNGIRNTQALLRKYPNADFAANWCDNEGGYLPACGELLALYNVKDNVDASMDTIQGATQLFQTDSKNWSSSEYSYFDAWYVYGGGDVYSSPKYGSYGRARAVRAYAPGTIKLFNNITIYSECETTSNTVEVVISPDYNLTDNQTVCDSYVFGGITYNTSGTYTHNFSSIHGCDSIVTLHLTVLPAIIDNIYDTVCFNDMPYTWTYNGGTTEITSAGFYSDSIWNGNCYDVWSLYLTVNPIYDLNETLTICSYELPYNWRGHVFPEGQISDTISYNEISSLGCDSIVTLNLTVNYSDTTEFSETACDIYTWNGVTYNQSNDYTQTFQNIHGCDSIVTLHLTINNSDMTDFAETACDIYTWNGVTYNQTGDYDQLFQNIHGCDSLVTLHLTINNSDMTDFSETACDTYTWNNITYNQTGDYDYLFQNIHGCDSIVTLHLTINNSDVTDFAETACNAYTWNNITYNQTGDYDQLFQNIHGCDSLVTLHLTITNSDMTDFAETACDTYTWNGITYNQTGDYDQLFQNIHGCDSLVTLHLTINNSDTTDFSETACDIYTWNGVTYNQSNDYTQTFQNIHGCDSIVTLHLTINHQPIVSDITAPAAIVHGGTLTLTAPQITENGSTVTAEGWQMSDTQDFTGVVEDYTGQTLDYTYNDWYLRYFATNNCGTSYSNVVTITVQGFPVVGSITAPDPICHNTALSLIAPSVDFRGQQSLGQGWQLSEDDTFTTYTDPFNMNLADTYDGWYLRYYATNATGTSYSDTVNIIVNEEVIINSISNVTYCKGVITDLIPFSVINNGGTARYEWTNDNTAIGLPASGNTDGIERFITMNNTNTTIVANITVTPFYEMNGIECEGAPEYFTITVNPGIVLNPISDQTVRNGEFTTAIEFSSLATGGTIQFVWTTDNPSIGINNSGVTAGVHAGIPSFQAVNNGTEPIVATIYIKGYYGSGNTMCDGASVMFKITVLP